MISNLPSLPLHLLGRQSRILIHSLQKVAQRTIRSMDERILEFLRSALDFHFFVDRPFLKSAPTFSKQTQIVVRIPTAVSDPTPREEIFPGNIKTVHRRVGGQTILHFLPQLQGDSLVRIQTENPFISGFVDGAIFLARESFPFLLENPRLKFLAYFPCPIGAPAVYDQDFIGPSYALQALADILLFVFRNDGDGDLFHIQDNR